MPHLLVIGGSDAGVTAARRARELSPSLEISVAFSDAFPSYSICGLPFLLSGEVGEVSALAHSLDFDGLALLPDTPIAELDLGARTALVAASAAGRTIAFDQLVIATGASPIRPDLPGADLPGVHLLHTMGEGLELNAALVAGAPRAVIMGAGYIGIEMADALTRRGLAVTLIGRTPQVLPTLDPDLGALVGGALRAHDVNVLDGREVVAIEPGEPLGVVDSVGERHAADLVLLSVGVTPNAELGAAAGCPRGRKGALVVDRSMATPRPGVFAAGDCATTRHRLLGDDAYLPLGSTAHKQGRVAGENVAGGNREFEGVLGTQVVKVFDLAAARTGLNDVEARRGGFAPLTVDAEPWDRNAYYPGASRLHLRITGDRGSGRLLGAQLVGDAGAEVAKRIDVVATALFCGLKVAQLADVDLSYSPPFASPWDALQQAALAWEARR